MTNGVGEVYWSERAQRYYQTGRRGALSNERGLRTLMYDEEANGFRDQRGRLVPEQALAVPLTRTQRFIGNDAEGRPFVRTVISDRTLSQIDARTTQLEGHEQVLVRITVRLPNGTVRTAYASSFLGGKVDLVALEEQAKRNLRGQLEREEKLDVDTPTISGGSFRVDYIKRTVRVR